MAELQPEAPFHDPWTRALSIILYFPHFLFSGLDFLLLILPSTASRTPRWKYGLPLIVPVTLPLHSLPSDAIEHNKRNNSYRASTLMKQKTPHHIRKSENINIPAQYCKICPRKRGIQLASRCSTLHLLLAGFESPSKSSLTILRGTSTL